MRRTKVQLKPNFNQFITWTQGPFPLAETFSQDLKCSQVENFAKIKIVLRVKIRRKVRTYKNQNLDRPKV